MTTHDEVKKLFQRHGHVMRTAELRASKIYYENIQRLISDGVIEKIKQGYYHLIDENDHSEVSICY